MAKTLEEIQGLGKQYASSADPAYQEATKNPEYGSALAFNNRYNQSSKQLSSEMANKILTEGGGSIDTLNKAQQEYEMYGKIVSQTPALSNPNYQFAGGVNDTAANKASLGALRQQLRTGEFEGVNTGQPNPATTQINPPSAPTPETIQAGFTAAQASGQPAPQGAGDARSAVQAFTSGAAAAPTFYRPDANSQQIYDSTGKALSYEDYKAAGGKGVMGQSNWTDVKNGSAPTPNATPIQGIEAQLAVDPGYQQLMKDYAEYNSITEKSKSLTDTYNEIVKSSGLQGINTDLINMKNVIEGTEDDIRNEVKAASGFATDSQVMALSQARNKTLIKSYNKLVDQQAAITNQVNTMVSLASQDRQFALQSINQKLQIDQQINDYRDKFVNNAKEGYMNVIKAVGYGGLVQSLQDDPSSVAMVEKTLGLPSGTLHVAAQHEVQEQAKAEEARQLDLSYKKAQIGNINSEIATRGAQLGLDRAKLGLEQQKFKADQEAKQAQTISTPMQLAQNQDKIKLANDILSNKSMKSSVGTNSFNRINAGSWRSIFAPGTSNFVASVEQLRSQLNLKALIDAKGSGATFGALSDQELSLLGSSATKLGTWAVKDKNGNVVGYNAKESDFKQEIDKINNFAKLDYVLKGGTASDVGVNVHADGTAWTTNSDGSVTQIYP